MKFQILLVSMQILFTTQNIQHLREWIVSCSVKKFCSTLTSSYEFVGLLSRHISLNPTVQNTLGIQTILLKLLNLWLWGKIQSWLIGLLRNHCRDLYAIMKNRGTVPIHSASSPLGVPCNYSCGALGGRQIKKELPWGQLARQSVRQPPSLSLCETNSLADRNGNALLKVTLYQTNVRSFSK